MLFQQPMALWGLTALVFPIILHLFYLQKPKTLVFSDLRFLKEVLQEQQRAKKLKDWLVLFFRLVLIACLVIAFARPYVPAEGGDQNRGVVLVLDNSASTANTWNDLQFFDIAKAKALALLKSMPADQQVILLHAASTEARKLTIQGAMQELSTLEPLPIPYTTDALNKQLNQSIFETGDWAVYIISDFQKGFLSEQPRVSEQFSYYLVPSSNTSSVSNLALDTAWFKQPIFVPGTTQELVVEVANHGPQDAASVDVGLMLNEQIKSIQPIDVPAGGKAQVMLAFAVPAEPFATVRLTIEDNGFATDNELFAAFKTTRELPVVLIQGGGSSGKLEPILSLSPIALNVLSPKQLDPNALSRAAAVVVEGSPEWQETNIDLLKELVVKGQTLLYFPLGDQVVDNLFFKAFTGRSSLLDTSNYSVTQLRPELPLFKGMIERIDENPSLPSTRWHYIFTPPAPSAMGFSNGDAFYFEQTLGSGKVWISTSGLSDAAGTWGDHNLLLPVIYQSIFQGQNQQTGYEILGKSTKWNTGIFATGVETPVSVSIADERYLPIQFLSSSGELLFEPLPQLNQLGSFPLVRNSDTLGWISFNLDKRESESNFEESPDMTPWGPTAILLSGSADAIGNQMIARTQGKPLWKYFLALAIISLLAESYLLRKKNTAKN